MKVINMESIWFLETRLQTFLKTFSSVYFDFLCHLRALQFTELIRNCEEAGFPKVTVA